MTLLYEMSFSVLTWNRYDALAFRYVSYVAIPLLIGYSIYSLIYDTHRGWYSFVISTATSFVYMFGFVGIFVKFSEQK
jgi:predicted membrane channel-forming protein YqfA (hemolysin III family)